MKNEKLHTLLLTGLLAFCVGFGAAECLATGLSLEVSAFLLIMCCLIWTVYVVWLLSLDNGDKLIWIVLGAVFVFILISGEFSREFRAIGYIAFTNYRKVYGWTIPDWMLGVNVKTHFWPVFASAIVVISLTVWTVLWRKPSVIVIATVIIVLTPTLMIVNTVPAAAPTWILLFGLALLLLTQPSWLQNRKHGTRLTACLLLPVMVSVLLLASAFPPEKYEMPKQLNSAKDFFHWTLVQLPFIEEDENGNLMLSVPQEVSTKQDLTTLGPRKDDETPVMRVTAAYNGRLYLRGCDYDRYDGSSWRSSQNRSEQYYASPREFTENNWETSIHTLRTYKQYFIPSYPEFVVQLENGYLANTAGETDYSFRQVSLINGWEQQWSGSVSTESEYGPAFDRYLELPHYSRQKAEEILQRDIMPNLGSNADPLSLVEAVAIYVRESAEYDTFTERMPGAEKDFVEWFLEKSDTGYCVHFATAAAVLLRAAEIPARYVDGYVVKTYKNSTVTVRQKMAHAWVEYYLDGVGWVILEATPSGGVENVASGGISQITTRPTAPAATQPSTKPSTQPTAPRETTTAKPTAPTTPGDRTDRIQKMLETASVILFWIIGLACIPLIVVAQWFFRRNWKMKRLFRGSPNRQALHRYREANRVAAVTKAYVPVQLDDLANKAKFSQHMLTPGELKTFSDYLQDQVRSMRQSPWYKQLVYRFIFAFY